MPNWCNNTVEIGHDDVSKMEALVAAINEGNFCKHVIPTPKELTETVAGHCGDGYEQELNQFKIQLNEKYFGAADWYNFQVNRWGTKWDVEPYDTVTLDGNGITFGFDSAWSPPIGVYEALVEQGFKVKAYYWESGMCFAGVWNNGDDNYYELGGMSSKEVADTIDLELDEVMCISESIANWEEDNAEEEETDDTK